MKTLALIAVLMCGILLLYGSGEFPGWGDPHSPASIHVSPYYIEKSLEETAVPNIVSAVLADYRGYDTMFETTVIFCAGIACIVLLRASRAKSTGAHFYRHVATGITLRIDERAEPLAQSREFVRIDKDWVPYDLIINITCRKVIPFIQLFALYVIAHGHDSPGGGFQGGMILGATIILFAVSHDLHSSLALLGEKMTAFFSTLGVCIYAGTGALSLLLGANFLDYSALSVLFFTDSVMARNHGIMMVEIGVGISVMAVMVGLYYNLASAGQFDEGL